MCSFTKNLSGLCVTGCCGVGILVHVLLSPESCPVSGSHMGRGAYCCGTVTEGLDCEREGKNNLCLDSSPPKWNVDLHTCIVAECGLACMYRGGMWTCIHVSKLSLKDTRMKLYARNECNTMYIELQL